MTPLHELFLERTGNEAAATLNELLVLGLIGIMGLVLLLLICAVVKKGFLKLTEFIRYKETLEKKAVPGEFAFDFEIYHWNDDIKEEEIIKNPTFDEVRFQGPEFEFRSFLPDREEPLFTTLKLKKKRLMVPRRLERIAGRYRPASRFHCPHCAHRPRNQLHHRRNLALAGLQPPPASQGEESRRGSPPRWTLPAD